MSPFLGTDRAAFLFLVLVVLGLILFSMAGLPALGYEPWSISTRRYAETSWWPLIFAAAFIVFLIFDLLILKAWTR